MAIDKDALDQLIAASGVGLRTAKKLRAANGTPSTTSSAKRSSGHGSACETVPVMPTI